MIVNILGSGLDAVVRTDFAPTAFVCDGANLLEPTIVKDTSLVGNGSSANPLGVKLSTDAGNDAIFGTDGGIFVDADAAFNFSITDGVNTEIVSDSDTVTFTAAGTGGLSVLVSAADTVTYSVPQGANFSIGLAADLGAPESIVQGDSITILGGSSITTTVSAADTVTVDVCISTDLGNQIVLGSDGCIFVPTPTDFSFSITDGVTTETITDGNTITFVDGTNVNVVVSATDTVTINVPVPVNTAVCPSGYFTGAPV